MMNDLQQNTQFAMDVNVFDCPFLDYELADAAELSEFEDLFD